MSGNTAKRRGHSSPRQSLEAGLTPKGTRHLVETDKGEKNTLPNATPLQVMEDRWHANYEIPVVEIEWVDAISTGDDWIDHEDMDTRPAPSLAVGYLVSDTPLSVTVVALVNEVHFANGLTIPKGCIVQMRTLA